MNFQIIISIILSCLSIEQAHSQAYTAMGFNLTSTVFNIHCSYAKLTSDSTFKALGVRRNTIKIAELLPGNKLNITLGVRDIEYVVQNAVSSTDIQISILNYRDESYEGTWECRLNYTRNGADHFETMQFKLDYQVAACNYTWVSTTITTVPSNAYVGAMQGNFGMIPCRTGGNVAGYVDGTKGCLITVNGTLIEVQQFDVLVGTGFFWKWRTNAIAKPSNALKFGTDQTGPIYLGRCSTTNYAYMGKITDDFYYNKNGVETKEGDCVEHHILTC